MRIKLVIQAAALHQAVMHALLDDAAVLEHQNAVGLTHGRQVDAR
jgi:hypothetical protein